jgi:hypothetical protein
MPEDFGFTDGRPLSEEALVRIQQKARRIVNTIGKLVGKEADTLQECAEINTWIAWCLVSSCEILDSGKRDSVRFALSAIESLPDTQALREGLRE